MPPKAKAQREVRLERNPRVLLKASRNFKKRKLRLSGMQFMHLAQLLAVLVLLGTTSLAARPVGHGAASTTDPSALRLESEILTCVMFTVFDSAPHTPLLAAFFRRRSCEQLHGCERSWTRAQIPPSRSMDIAPL